LAAVKDKLLDFLESQLDPALALLERMVEINSFTANPDGVNELGAVTAAAFAPLGFKAEMIPSQYPDCGQHLFLRRRANRTRPIVFVTHLDTVFPAYEEAQNDFRWRPAPEEDRIYGPGTVDIKGGTAVMWLVLQALAELAPATFLDNDWLLAANSSEETLSADFAAQTIGRCPGGAQAVLVFEGGYVRGRELTLVTARKGKVDYRMRISGRAAHAGSRHEEGRNAIVALADCVQRAAALNDYARELTVNVGTLNGGTVVNRVPHFATADLEMRAFDPQVLASAQAAIESLAGDSPAVPGALVSIEKLGETAPWPGSDKNLTLFQTFASAAATLAFTAVAERRGGLSDANYLHSLGPTLDGLGPSGGNSHCSERSADGLKVPEYVEISSFLPKAALTALALAEMTRE
jgi:glutamate carboxypeptidase